MNKKLNLYIVFAGMLALLFACEKDETKVVIKSNPTPPAILTMPELTLTRATSTDTLEFSCTGVDPGFVASANYFLEADSAGNNFKNAVVIANGISPHSFIMTVSGLNGLLIKRFPTDVTSTAEFRLRAVLVIDAGTGYTPIVSISDIETATIKTFGLPRLDLIGPAVTQKIESANGDGHYFGFVKFNTAEPFKLYDPETGITYGLAGGTLSVDGPELTPPADGWHKFTVNTNDLTFSTEAFMIGWVGTATPNAWDSPDQKMDYDSKTGTWRITADALDGEYKFRLNDGWAWNLGGTEDALVHNGANLAITAGNYTFILTITNETPGSEAGTVEVIKNN